MVSQLEKLQQEEAELEAAMIAKSSAQMLGNQTEEDTQDTEESDVSTTDEDDVETEEEREAAAQMEETIMGQADDDEDSDDDTDDDDQPQKPKRVSWKKRFINFKKSADSTISAGRRENLELRAEIDRLKLELYKLQTQLAEREEQGDLFDGVFTPEDEDTFGAEGLDVVKKVAKTAIERQVKPLKEELKRQQELSLKEQSARTQAERVAEYQTFLSKLETLVPEYAALNVDPGFLDWIKEPDDISGSIRSDLFRRAEASRDVGRVADFFKQYQAKISAVKAPSKVNKDIERHITPVGSGGGSSSTTKKKSDDEGYIRQSDIDKFYSDMMKGRYRDKPDVIKATEAFIERATRDQRVLRGQ